MNHEKKLLLDRRRKLCDKPHIDMTPRDIREYERIVKRLNEIELYEISVRLKKRTERGQKDVIGEKTDLDS